MGLHATALPAEILGYQSRIDNVIKRAESLPFDDYELRALLAKYVCVMASGLLEVAVRVLILRWCTERSHPTPLRYVDRQLQRFQNPKMAKILDEVEKFDPRWRVVLREAITDEQKDAVDSIVNNRNRIAHGENVGLSLAPMKRYYEQANQVIEHLARCVV